MIDSLTNAGSIEVIERLMQFSGQRHRIITNNVANLDTPGFRPVDVSVEDFQRQLGKAIDSRRAANAHSHADLKIDSTREVEFSGDGLILHPTPAAENLLFHDGNDRNVERIMQDLVENFMTFRTAAQLLRSRFDLLDSAIRERT